MPSSPTVALPRDRREQILEQLDSEGSVRVTTLAKQFAVAEETIRRDLDRMSEAGQLVRTHGGAIRLRSDWQDYPLAVRRSTNAAEKQQIGQLAAERIEPGDTIALDASTTALALASALPDISATVVTNSLDAARIISERRSLQVLLTGGELDADSMCLLGPIAEATLRSFSFNKAMLSCKAIDPQRGMSEASVAHASLKRWMIDQAEETYLLADHSKFGVRSVSFFGKLTEVDVLVTDKQTDQELIASCRSCGLEALVAAKEGI